MSKVTVFLSGIATAMALVSSPAATADEIEAVLAHPPFGVYYICGEHAQGQLEHQGDALGTDCMIAELVTVDGRTWPRLYAGDGTSNDQWFSWRAPVHSPCDCEVVRVNDNPVVNEPGVLGEPPASFVILRRDDGVQFLLAHIQEPSVEVGSRVKYGQAIALVGNNGYGRNPHVHVGAWKGKTALQLRWDQRFMAGAKAAAR